jgi:cytoskeletal protein RodZ
MSSQLKHKFEQFEATPPKDAWLAIEERLNNTDTTLQDRLYNFEEVPPAATWNEIATTLDNFSTQRESILLTNKKWFRYATAAVILGVIALGVLTYATQKPESTIAHQPLVKQQKTLSENTKNTSANANQADASVETIIPLKEESISVPASTSAQSSTSTIAKRYKVVAKEDGQIVRLSQKAYAVFDCAVKEAAQKSANCKENIQTMQAKMATSNISPSADFAGLIDMIKTLEENK